MIISLISAIAVFFIFYKSRFKIFYSAFIFIGNLIPDLIDFGITGIKILSFNPRVIMRDSWFSILALFAHSFRNWAVFALIVILIFLILYGLKIVSKRFFYAVVICVVLLVFGVVIHLYLDASIIERSVWI